MFKILPPILQLWKGNTLKSVLRVAASIRRYFPFLDSLSKLKEKGISSFELLPIGTISRKTKFWFSGMYPHSSESSSSSGSSSPPSDSASRKSSNLFGFTSSKSANFSMKLGSLGSMFIHLPEYDQFVCHAFHGCDIMNCCHFPQRHEISKVDIVKYTGVKT